MPVYRNINKNFFKKISPESAYVLGFFVADGNIVKTNRGTHFISFYSADMQILSAIKKVMKSDHKISQRNSTAGHVYRLQIGSKEMFEDLIRLNITPNKARRMHLPDIPPKHFNHFVRGYFDGDGNVWTRGITLQVSFTSASKQFLSELLQKLRSLGILGGSIFDVKNKNCSRLTLSKRDSLKLYKIMYNVPHKLHLKRKRLVFERFARMRS